MKPDYIDHIVVIVKNVEKTKEFYSKFLGQPDYVSEDSISYKIGKTKIFLGLSYGKYQKFDKDRGGLNHLAFGVKTDEELKEFSKVLNIFNIKNSGIQIDKYGGKEFVWFDDPDGYRLEFYLRPSENSKNFIGWFEVKKKIDESDNKIPLFKEGEIWWCMVGENVGIEMGGKGDFFTRPILIFKKLSKDGFLGIPMSTQDKSGTWYVKVKQSGENVTVVLSQTKVFSSRRLYAKIGELDDVDCAKVGDAFFKLFTHSNQKFSPPSGGVVGKSQI